ncbi:nuclease A inhibitor family protein [Hymenobacter sp. BT175]|nr:nuclease A inhibitor family protein [Hymenobacter translucens]MCC2545154.1 nuclease A inhibitor family protein [Hymenobacter translucens]
MKELASAISAQVPAAGGRSKGEEKKPLESKADREIKGAGSQADDPTLAQLRTLTKGLYFVSESEAELEAVRYDAPASALSDAELLRLTGQPAGTPVETQELTYFLRNHTADDGVLGDPDLANRYKALQMFMKQDLNEARVYRIGTGPQVQAFALGKTGEGKLVGFKTVLTET